MLYNCANTHKLLCVNKHPFNLIIISANIVYLNNFLYTTNRLDSNLLFCFLSEKSEIRFFPSILNNRLFRKEEIDGLLKLRFYYNLALDIQKKHNNLKHITFEFVFLFKTKNKSFVTYNFTFLLIM